MTMINTVDYWRWKSFTPLEVLSPTGLKQYADGNLLLQPSALDTLEQFRNSLGKPLLCNLPNAPHRGYRSQTENADIYRTQGGEPGECLLSRHTQGIAFDLSCADCGLDDLYHAALAFGFGAVFIYPAHNFIHCDCRAILNGVQMHGRR